MKLKNKIKKQKHIHKLIDKFCEVQSLSTGGYAPVAEGDIDKLHRIINAIIEAKYGPDPDGDTPIDFRLIDRTNFRPMHYFNVPYEHNAKTEEQTEELLDLLLRNVSIANDALSTHISVRKKITGRK